jgi:hypothetical protein
MTPENKEQAKNEIVEFLKNKFSEYPEIDPKLVIHEAPAIYKLLIEKSLIEEAAIPFPQFQHIIVDQYRSAMIMDQLNSFF